MQYIYKNISKLFLNKSEIHKEMYKATLISKSSKVLDIPYLIEALLWEMYVPYLWQLGSSNLLKFNYCEMHNN